MSFVRRLDMGKLWAPIIAVAILTSVTIAFLLVRDTSAPVSATPPAAEPSYQVADKQVPSDPGKAEQAAADQATREPAAPHQDPDDRTADQISASETPQPETSPAPQPDVPPQQTIFRSRRALETIDPRELLRQGHIPN